jgi:hypothetical protein
MNQATQIWAAVLVVIALLLLATPLRAQGFGPAADSRPGRWALVPLLNRLMPTTGRLLREDARNGGFTATRVADDLSQLSLQVGFGTTRH